MTVLGKNTVGDVVDLLNAKTYDVNRLEANIFAFQPHWGQVDPSALNDFMYDWTEFLARWGTAVDAANGTIRALPNAPLALIPDQGDFDALLRALKKVDGVISKGDYDDLWKRLNDANTQWGGNADFSNWNTPQPTMPDADITALQLADEVLGSPSSHKAAESELKKDLTIAGVAIGVAAVAYGAVKLSLKALLLGL